MHIFNASLFFGDRLCLHIFEVETVTEDRTEVDEDINGFTHEKKFSTVALTCLEGGGFDPL